MDKTIKNISPIGKISGNLDIDKTISGNVIQGVSKTISGNVIQGIGKGEVIPIYEGNYNILPLAFQETILQTKNKKLVNNIIIREIPYYETSNPSGGNTVYIAGQVEFG